MILINAYFNGCFMDRECILPHDVMDIIFSMHGVKTFVHLIAKDNLSKSNEKHNMSFHHFKRDFQSFPSVNP